MTYLHGLLAIAGTMVVITGAVGTICTLAVCNRVGDGDCKAVEDDSHAPEDWVAKGKLEGGLQDSTRFFGQQSTMDMLKSFFSTVSAPR